MTKYTCNGCRAITMDDVSAGEVAQMFADRLARQKYGRAGYARTCNLNSYSSDGTTGEYQAFLGYTVDKASYTTAGHNVSFTMLAQKVEVAQ